MKLDYKIVLIVILIIALCTMSYLNKRTLSRKNSEITLLKGNNDSLYTLVNKQGEIITSKEAEVVSSKDILKQYTDSIFSLQEKHSRQIAGVISFYQSKQSVTVKEVEVPYLDTTGMKKFSDSVELQCQEVLTFMRDSTIKVPKLAAVETKDLSLKLTVTKTGVVVDSLSLIDTLSVRVVEVKGGFFKKKAIGDSKRVFFKRKSFEVQTKHSSPYFSNEWQQSFIYQAPKNHAFIKGVGTAALGFVILTLAL